LKPPPQSAKKAQDFALICKPIEPQFKQPRFSQGFPQLLQHCPRVHCRHYGADGLTAKQGPISLNLQAK
jgi:hypothetical protein